MSSPHTPRGATMRTALAALAAIAALASAAAADARTGPVQLGAAVGGSPFMGDPDPRYRGTLALYDSLTAENDMKMYYQRPSRETFDFAVGDAIVDFAEARGQKVHGHTLVWCYDSSNPGWLRNRSWTRGELLRVLEEHITTVVSRYRGRVSAWDVVNEALADDGERRDCLWQRVIGDDWIEQAFRIARRADPTARLYYNEVRADTVNPKYEAMLGLARDLLARGVPLDGIGLQFHLTDRQPAQADVEPAIRRIGELGLDVHISELDVPVWYLGATLERRLARQARTYGAIASACEAQPACVRITTWGFTDRYTWRCCDAKPLPFDEEYRPKPAWAAMQEVLRPPAPPAPADPPPDQVPVGGVAAQHPAAAQSPPQVPVGAAAAAPAAQRPLSLSATVRRQRLNTLLRRRALTVVLRLEGATSARVRLAARLRGRVLGRGHVDAVGAAPRHVTLRLSAAATRDLRRAGGARVVVIAVATDEHGRRARARSVAGPVR